MADNAGGDCAAVCCGLCCVEMFSALSNYCYTVAPGPCRCCPAKTDSAYEDAVKKDMERSKAEDAAKNHTQPQPTPDMSTQPAVTSETKE